MQSLYNPAEDLYEFMFRRIKVEYMHLKTNTVGLIGAVSGNLMNLFFVAVSHKQ